MATIEHKSDIYVSANYNLASSNCQINSEGEIQDGYHFQYVNGWKLLMIDRCELRLGLTNFRIAPPIYYKYMYICPTEIEFVNILIIFS